MAERRHRPVAAALLSIGLAVAGAGAFPMAASAAALTVTSAADSGAGSLRALVASSVSGDTIVIPPAITSILLETSIDINHSLTIAGPGSSLVVERGADPNINLFSIVGAASPDVTISGMRITASAGDFGVAIGGTSAHDLTLRDLTVENQEYSGGGAVFLFGTTGDVVIENSTFSNNTGSGNQDGGAVRIDNVANLTITGSRFTGNSAGGAGALFVTQMTGALTIDSTEFANNQATGPALVAGAIADGGAIAIDQIVVDSTITNSTFASNSATFVAGGKVARGGAVRIAALSNARLTISTSSFSGNSSTDGGGALSIDSLNGTAADGLVIRDSVFDGNATDAEGSSINVGVVSAPLTIQNTTVDDGLTGLGAVYLGDIGSALVGNALAVSNSTIVGPGGLTAGTFSAGAALIDHTILASTSGLGALNIVSPGALVMDLYYVLLSSAFDPAVANNVSGSSLFGVADMKLAPLANNGGPTLTRLPATDSPARNGGDPSYAGLSPFDQRGTGFDRRIGVIDIGAVETTATLAATGGTINPLVPVAGGILLVLGVIAILVARGRRAKAVAGEEAPTER